MALYGSIPFLMALRPRLALGMLWLSASETFIDIESGGKVLMHIVEFHLTLPFVR